MRRRRANVVQAQAGSTERNPMFFRFRHLMGGQRQFVQSRNQPNERSAHKNVFSQKHPEHLSTSDYSEPDARNSIFAEPTMLELADHRPPKAQRSRKSWLVRGRETEKRSISKRWKRESSCKCGSLEFPRASSFHSLSGDESFKHPIFQVSGSPQAADQGSFEDTQGNPFEVETNYGETSSHIAHPSPFARIPSASPSLSSPNSGPCNTKSCSNLKIFRLFTM